MVGALLGAGWLVGSGRLQAPWDAGRLTAEKQALVEKRRKYDTELAQRQAAIAAAEQRAREAAAAEAALRAKRAAEEAEARARAEAEAEAEAERAKAAEKKGKTQAQGTLVIRSLSTDFEVDAGQNRGGRGRLVEVPFVSAPGKIRVKASRFTVVLVPHLTPGTKSLRLDVSVSPMALVSANDERLGPSARGLTVDRKPFKLDLQSPVAGDLNLILTYRR